MEIQPFLPIISGFLGGAASAGLFKGPVETVQDWWYVHFGHDANEQANMLRARQSVNVEKYRNDMLREISKVEPKNIKEPELKILGPALEASKFYIEEEPLRIMFAKLIASSMDSSKDEIIHSSYVEIIKQLTPLDADNLLSIHLNNNRGLVCNLKQNYSTGGFDTVYTNLYLGNFNCAKQKIIGPSLDNLDRLGLVEITFQEYAILDSAYEPFEQIEEYRLLSDVIRQTNYKNDALRKNPHVINHLDVEKIPTLSGPELQKGLAVITPFGKNFCSTCL